MSIEGRRNPPHASPSVTRFALLLHGIFVKPVRRIRHDRMEGVVSLPRQPIEAVRVKESSSSEGHRLAPMTDLRKLPLPPSALAVPRAVNPALLPHEQSRGVEPQVRPQRGLGRGPDEPGHAFFDLLERGASVTVTALGEWRPGRVREDSDRGPGPSDGSLDVWTFFVYGRHVWLRRGQIARKIFLPRSGAQPSACNGCKSSWLLIVSDDDLVRVPLFGQEELAVVGKLLFARVTRDEGEEVRRAAVALGPQDATKPLGLFLA
jgi:hypothetical protein